VASPLEGCGVGRRDGGGPFMSPATHAWLRGPLSRTGLTVLVFALAIDQAHKWWMLLIYRIQDKGRVAIGPFLDLVFVKNTGVSYGLFVQNAVWGQLLLSALAAIAVLAMAYWLAKLVSETLTAISLGLIMGGALSNAIDRLLIGGVADFFSLHAFGFYWYVFNIADMAIVAGVIGLLYDALVASRNGAAKST
jgi:signal peptidase II